MANGARPKINKVFKTITQPQDQIESIINALEDCLKIINPDIYFKVALMNIKNNQLDDWLYFLPYNEKPKTDIAELRNSKSTISRCLAEKKLKIVEDVQKEIKKGLTNDTMYIPGNTPPDEEWSQLCYPIRSITSNEVIFIIAIAAKKKNFFSFDLSESYNWLLKFFESRLALEHSLKELKTRANP